jgi:hypothetical protein
MQKTPPILDYFLASVLQPSARTSNANHHKSHKN